ncbi:MAG: hypothetical protein JST06_00675 [Bacteroidetes bacterium]|nr:hypothetical protein [Bacteroidota bacterium]MBS1630043.1 hypothetical protein [Bacteroidota bacterium]
MLNPVAYKPLRPAHLLLACLLFCSLALLSYPFYRYYVDPDAVAYLTMARRAAAGAPWRLVNALWSPFHPALVAVCVRLGMDALVAAQATNALACLLLLTGSYSLFRQNKMAADAGFPLLLALAGFLCYALYKQLFCDLWQTALLLFYLLLINRASFLWKPLLWLLAGVLMALAAYAKIYSFYFLLLHLPVAVWLLSRSAGKSFSWRPFLVSITTMLVLMVPLATLMHHKYGFWNVSKSGALNTSWTLVGHKSLRSDIHTLIPPPYINSPYTWEDPYVAEGPEHTRFESLSMIKSQAGHSVQAALQGLEASAQISPFLLIIFLATAVTLVLRKRLFSVQEKVLFAAAVIMPLGYLLLHIEARYLWLLLPIGMNLGSRWLRISAPFFEKNKKLYQGLCWLLALSFVTYPLYDLKAMFREGEASYRLAQKIKVLHLEGSFAADGNPSKMGLLAYWTGNRYYAPATASLNRDSVLADMRRYGIPYFIHVRGLMEITDPIFRNETGTPFPRVDEGQLGPLCVYLILPANTAAKAGMPD